MREDMARVLVGRPRSGMRLRLKRRKLHQNACRVPDDSLCREPMSRGRGTKCLNENLSPLERYLRSQVGRPWNVVYSEISARLRISNAVQQHVRDHLRDFVAVHTWLEDGEVVLQRIWGQRMALGDSSAGRLFYVCPSTGVLREHAPRRPRRVANSDPDVRWQGPWRQLRRIESIWYALALAPIPESLLARAQARDCFLGETLERLLSGRETRDPLAAAYGRAGIYAAGKRQLAKRELRSLDVPRPGHARGERR
jgi:hypothetical protein